MRLKMSESFAPLLGKQPHTLILGTMPGQASLTALQYYAHPRNALWPILIAITNDEEPDFSRAQSLNYQQRCKLLYSSGFALWDVLARCERPGSLDSNIQRSSEVPNDIIGLLAEQKRITRIACNGKTAGKLFKRHIVPLLTPTQLTELTIIPLPSTSPAMASINLTQKYQTWAAGLLG